MLLSSSWRQLEDFYLWGENMLKLKFYINYFVLCWRVLWSLKDCQTFLERPNRFSKRRTKHIIVPVENQLRNERKGGDIVNRQDMLSYFLASAMKEGDTKEVNDELADVVALIAACICEPLQDETTEGSE